MIVRARISLPHKLSRPFALILLLALIVLPGSISRGQDVTATPPEQEPPTLVPLPTDTATLLPTNTLSPPTATETPTETATLLPTDTLSPPTAAETPTETSSPTPSPAETPTEMPTETPTVTDTLLPVFTETPTIPSGPPTAAPSPSATMIPVGPIVLLNDTAEIETGVWSFEGTWNRSNLEAAHTGGWIFSDNPGAPYAANQVTAMSLVQPLSLPPNTQVQLQYWQRLDLGAKGTAQVQVSTDNVTWTTVVGETAVRNLAWTVRTVHLDAYAGQPLWLRFVLSADRNPHQVGDGWWLDDITVTATPLPVMPLVGLSAAQSDDPAVWLTEGTWQTTTAPVYNGSTAWTSAPQSETAVALTLNADVSLAGFSQPELRFAHMLDLAAGGDSAQVQVSTDGGQTWFTLATYTATHNTGVWSEQAVSLAAHLGQTVRVRFLLAIDGDGVQGTGWTVDAIALQDAVTLPPTEPTTSTPTIEEIPSPTPEPEVGWITYQDTDPLLAYGSIWQTYSVSGAAGGTLTGTGEVGATLIVYFEGSGIQVVYSKGPEGGPFTVQVDGDPAQMADGYADGYRYGYALTFDYLLPGQHELTVTNGTGALWVEAVAAQGSLIAAPVSTPTPTPMPSLTPTPDTTWTTTQDTDPLLIYGIGSWQSFEVTAATGGTLTGSADTGATLVAYFDGTGIRVVYSKGPEGAGFTAQIDGGVPQTVDNHDTGYSSNYLLAFEGLAAGPHTLTVINGTGAIWIEAVQVQGTLVLPRLPTGEPGIVGGVSISAGSSEAGSQTIIVPEVTTSSPEDLLQDFENPSSPPWTIGGAPEYLLGTSADSPAIGPEKGHAALARNLSPYEVGIEVQVDWQLGSSPDQTFRVVSFDSWLDWAIGQIPGWWARYHEVRLIMRDPTNQVLFSEVICVYNPFAASCPVYAYPPVDGVSSMTLIQRTLGDVYADPYHLSLDDLRVTVEVPEPPNICTATVDESLGSVSSDMTIYTGPGEDYPATGTLTDGQVITLLAMEPGTPNWYQIQGFDPANPDRFGWVKETVLVIDESAACQNLTMCSLTQAPLAMAMEDSVLVGDSSAYVCQIAPPPILISKSISNAVLPVGALNEFAITVTNQSGEIQQSITVIDPLPEGLTIPPGGLIAPTGSTVTLNENGEVVWIIDSLGIDASTELRFTVLVDTDLFADLLGQEIVNNAQIASVGGEPAPSQFQAYASFVPVVCEGQPTYGAINVRETPSQNSASLTELGVEQRAGVINIPLSPNPDDPNYPLWYRVVVPTQDEAGVTTFVFGWVVANLFASDCPAPIVDQNGRLFPVPDQVQHERLAFLLEDEKIYTKEEITTKTNGGIVDDEGRDSIPTNTLVIVTQVHPNRQYIQVSYFGSSGNLIEGNQWVQVRDVREDDYGDLKVINSTVQDYGDTTFTVMPLEYVPNANWSGKIIDNRQELEALIMPESELPGCLEGQVVNCLPSGNQNGCDEIFGCPLQPAFVLNAFKDEEDGGRGPTYCGAWAATHTNWHCGIDLVKQADAVRNDFRHREVFTAHGGLVSFWSSGDATLGIRDREENYAREYQYVHLIPIESLVDSSDTLHFEGEYLASGSKLGEYGPRGAVGPIAVHVHYVEKIYVAYTNSESILSLTEIRRDPADHEYEVPDGFAGNPPRYIPICHPDHDFQEYIQHSEGDGETLPLFPAPVPRYEWREGQEVCMPAQVIRTCKEWNGSAYISSHAPEDFSGTNRALLPPGVELSDDGTLEGIIAQDAANGSPYQVRIEAQAQCREGVRTGWIEFEWRIVEQ